MTLRRVKHSLWELISAPIQPTLHMVEGIQEHGPLCLTCGRVVPRESIVDDRRTSVDMLFECHGEQELRTYDFESETWPENSFDPDDRYQQLRRYRMGDRLFDPMRHAGK